MWKVGEVVIENELDPDLLLCGDRIPNCTVWGVLFIRGGSDAVSIMFAIIQRENDQACEEGLQRKRSIPGVRGE